MTVYLVGAGPGGPGLLTRRGEQLLRSADVVVHDRLVDSAVLALAHPDAELIDVGKRPGEPGGPRQEHINDLLVSHGAAGKLVVRLKGGDPFVFGRGGEEGEALDRAGVPWQVVPGVSSAFGVPATAGIPVTHRGVSTSVTVVTGHVGDPTAPGGVDWDSLARAGGTVVVLMGMAHREQIARCLVEGGRSPDTPAAVVQWGTTSAQRVVRTTLDRLGAVDLGSPAIIVVGDVAALDLGSPLDPGSPPPVAGQPGAQRGPLAAKTVVVTRPVDQAGPVRRALEAAGARVLLVPATAIVGPGDGAAALRRATERLREFDWIVFTSANAVDRLLQEVVDVRALGGARLAAVGRATAEALARHRLLADLVPGKATAEGLVEELPGPATGDGTREGAGGRVLYPKAAEARPTLGDGLRAKGWDVQEVEAYRTVPADPPAPGVVERLVSADAVVFAAPSAIDAYLSMRDAGGRPLAVPPLVACIGPVTAEAARGRDLAVGAVASRPSPDALVDALVQAWVERTGA